MVVIDHHVSTEKDIKCLKEYVFDNKHSGAYLTHKYFFPNQKVPTLFKYISDYDTFNNKLPFTKEITTYIYKDDLDELTFRRLKELEKELDTEKGFKVAKGTGNLINFSETKQIDHYKKKAEKVKFEGLDVIAVSSPRDLRADLGFLLAEDTPNFAMVFFFEDDIFKCSLRSVSGFDVSKIAEKYGGGGHKNSALFRVPEKFVLSQFLKKI